MTAKCATRDRPKGIQYQRFTDADRRSWERLYTGRKQLSTTEIARRTGAPQSTVALHLKQQGLTRSSIEARKIFFAKADRESLRDACVRMFREGVPVEEIARRCKQKPDDDRPSILDIVTSHLWSAGLDPTKPPKQRPR